jgi:uncharacterized protein (DUF427 family)
MFSPPTRLDPAPFRVRAWKVGVLLVDSRNAQLGSSPKPPNFWLFPKADVTAPAEAVELEHEGLVALKWDAADEWWEEDERVFGGHPRDPRHRVDARQSSRHVVVRWKDAVIADSHRPVLIFETGLPLRYYLPRADVRAQVLRRAELTTWCPYKGECHYYDIALDGAKRPSALWTYETPLVDAPPGFAGLIGVWHEKLTVTVDGVAL